MVSCNVGQSQLIETEISKEGAGLERPRRTRTYIDQAGLPAEDPLAPADGHTETSVPFQTKPDKFGVYRVYEFGRPSHSPDQLFDISLVADGPNLESSQPKSNPRLVDPVPYAFRNASIDLFMQWYNTRESTVLSKAAGQSLVKDVILHPEFRKEHLQGFDLDKELRHVDNLANDPLNHFPVQDQWQKGSISIAVPSPARGTPSIKAAEHFTVEGVVYRKLTELIQSAFHEPAAEYFHVAPFKEFWQPSPDHPPEQLYSEIYSSEAYLKAEREIREIMKADGCTLEPLVIVIMIWSDATCLAQFGDATLWPIYIYIGNLSKDIRSKPKSMSAHHYYNLK
ncbi:hypothetical protein BKA70DRAFT_1104224 [Coprinopsis sp. MPI-PUGE-AT-0042]|nr:hypothetical protein BKA70DRAFT_1104224 [Coprinopsis sp. MPI-PUGE-AT-0042]